jgi:hypothetical protein
MTDQCIKDSHYVSNQEPLNTFSHNFRQIFHMIKTRFAQADVIIENFNHRIDLLFAQVASLEGIN